MNLLIDGNNLAFAVLNADGNPVGRQHLCRMLASLLPVGGRAHVVFDGPPPRLLPPPEPKAQVRVEYAAPQSADEVLLRRIREDSAPRRLTVVSSDHEIRQAARRRRCRSVTSEDFAAFIERLSRPARLAPPGEPDEKTRGLSPQQLDAWLKEFGVEP
jgi:hypothetical protein